MPTYQYSCTSCAHHLEAVQSFSDAALTECPECSGTLRKVFSAVGVVFKGSGFYRTDSRSSGGDSAVRTEKKPSTESAGKTEKATSTTTSASTSSS